MEQDAEHESPTVGPWNGRSFVEAIRNSTLECKIYTDEEKEDSTDDLSLADVIQPYERPNEPTVCPAVDISWKEYRKSWVPGHRALILRTFGWSFSYKLIVPKIKKLWQLTNDYKIIDIDKGFLVAQFYSCEDYLKVLQGGIMGGVWTLPYDLQMAPQFHTCRHHH